MYRAHLRHAHKMSLAPLQTTRPRTRLQQNRNILPDASNPEFYCAGCDFKFALKGNFRQHLLKAHHMALTPLKRGKKTKHLNNTSEPENNRSHFLHCEICNKHYASRSRYHFHMKRMHKIDNLLATPSQRRSSRLFSRSQ